MNPHATKHNLLKPDLEVSVSERDLPWPDGQKWEEFLIAAALLIIFVCWLFWCTSTNQHRKIQNAGIASSTTRCIKLHMTWTIQGENIALSFSEAVIYLLSLHNIKLYQKSSRLSYHLKTVVYCFYFIFFLYSKGVSSFFFFIFFNSSFAVLQQSCKCFKPLFSSILLLDIALSITQSWSMTSRSSNRLSFYLCSSNDFSWNSFEEFFFWPLTDITNLLFIILSQ